jgi:metacaspase-1
MKYALLIGINYVGTDNELNGCINDINNMNAFLRSARNYTRFIIMTDNTKIKPTKANILSAFNVLLKTVKPGDELWVHYSGHGTLTCDNNRDEESGFDSCICPLDFQRSGFITDDIIRTNLALKVPKGVTLYIVLDACHSGTGCDLRYKYDDSSYLINKNSPLPTNYISTDWALVQTSYEFKKYGKTLGDVYCISGCQDNQTSADAYISGAYAGALTSILLSSLKANPLQTYKWKHLLKDICCGEKINGFDQRTAITSGGPLNLDGCVFNTPVLSTSQQTKKEISLQSCTRNIQRPHHLKNILNNLQLSNK